MVREAPAAWSCFFILHIISNPDTKKKPPPGLSTQLCAPLEFGGFVQRLHIPDQSHPPCLLSRVAWMMSLGPCSSSSGGSRSAPRSRARAARVCLSQWPTEWQTYQLSTLILLLFPHITASLCLFLSPHRLIFMIYWLLLVLHVWVCVCPTPPPRSTCSWDWKWGEKRKRT